MAQREIGWVWFLSGFQKTGPGMPVYDDDIGLCDLCDDPAAYTNVVCVVDDLVGGTTTCRHDLCSDHMKDAEEVGV